MVDGLTDVTIGTLTDGYTSVQSSSGVLFPLLVLVNVTNTSDLVKILVGAIVVAVGAGGTWAMILLVSIQEIGTTAKVDISYMLRVMQE